MQVWKLAQRPNVALVQYWPGAQSLIVWHWAAAHSPSAQMRPVPQVASLRQWRKQVPCWQVYSAVATFGSTPGAQSVAKVHGGMHSPWETSQRWLEGQEASLVQRERVSHFPLTQLWFSAQAASEVHVHWPAFEQTKPDAQSVSCAHSGAAAHFPSRHTCREPQSASSSQIGPQAPKRQRPSGH